MREIIYPLISHDEKKNIKLKLDDIEKIKHLFNVEKLSISEIAEKFNVSQQSIKYHIDDEYKQKHLVASKKYISERYKYDEKFRKRSEYNTNKFISKRRIDDLMFRNYLYDLKKKYNKTDFGRYSLKKSRLKYEQSELGKFKRRLRNRLLRVKEYQKKYRLQHLKHLQEYQRNRYKNNTLIKRHIQYAMRWF